MTPFSRPRRSGARSSKSSGRAGIPAPSASTQPRRCPGRSVTPNRRSTQCSVSGGRPWSLFRYTSRRSTRQTKDISSPPRTTSASRSYCRSLQPRVSKVASASKDTPFLAHSVRRIVSAMPGASKIPWTQLPYTFPPPLRAVISCRLRPM